MFNVKKDYRNRSKLAALHLLVGASLIITMLGLSGDYTAGQMVFYLIIGFAMALLGLVEFSRYRRDMKAHEMDFSAGFEAEETGSEPALTQFREDCAAFFLSDGIPENSAVQSDTTQLYKAVLDRHKKRLDRLGMQMELRSVRKKYTDASVSKETCFDGKYEVTDFDEEIEAKRRYTRRGEALFLRTSNQAAHYTLIDAKQVGEDGVVCPNCGHVTTRENLIDGCDYCGTRFTVEDLGKKVSSFAFRDKYEIAYAKYKSLRIDYSFNAILVAFVVICLFFLFCFAVLLFDEPADGSDVMNPFFWVFSSLGVAGSFAFLFTIPFTAFYVAVVLPLMNIGASFRYNSKKKLAALRAEEQAAEAFAEKVRAFDPLFSAADLYSNVQNKLSSVLFAQNEAEINTFAETDLRAYLPKFAEVFDYDIDRMRFTGFDADGGLQRITLSADLRLFTFEAGKVKTVKRTAMMRLIKSAACRTRAVCAPSVMRCKSCGGSLSLSEGLVCPYCGVRANVKDFDWVIEEFKVS